MALTGLDIYKLLPKTNCKKCGFPTCLAFAMALAAKKVSLELCPEVTEETKQILSEAAEPPIRTITIKENYKIGGETVLFRHEKTFYNPTLLGVLLKDTLSEEEISEKIKLFSNLTFDRVGRKFKTEILMIKSEVNDIEKIKSIISKIQNIDCIIGLTSYNPSLVDEILKTFPGKVNFIGFATKDNTSEFVNLAKQNNIPLIVDGKTLDETIEIVNKIVNSGYREIILKVPTENIKTTLEYLTQIRRLALKRTYRQFGYPTCLIIENETLLENISYGSLGILKYGSMVILGASKPYLHLSLITLRMNIYTDPQKPVTVEPKLYKIGGEPTPESPLLVTTNFSLTYYSVEPEILNSKIPSWLLIVNTDGLSVLTAWAAEKFTPEKIVDAINKENVLEKVSHKKIIIPGYVAVMSGKLNELLPGWQVIVGPKESSGIPKFLKTIM